MFYLEVLHCQNCFSSKKGKQITISYLFQ